MKTIYDKNNSWSTREIEDYETCPTEHWTEIAPPDNTGRYAFANGAWHVWGTYAKLPVRYSKLKIVRALKAAGIWAGVKAAIESADAMDEWNAAAWLAESDPLFAAMRDTLSAAYPGTDINTLLANCLY